MQIDNGLWRSLKHSGDRNLSDEHASLVSVYDEGVLGRAHTRDTSYYYLVTSYFKPTALLFGSWYAALKLLQ